ncbi:MAG: family metallopeptidase [Chloroflexi bacterium]|nr:family metallopeptidase [Chloroflexota bacterium]
MVGSRQRESSEPNRRSSRACAERGSTEPVPELYHNFVPIDRWAMTIQTGQTVTQDETATDPQAPPADASDETPPFQRPRNLLPYPYFSQAERDRRWSLVRLAMAQVSVDCIIVPPDASGSGRLAAHARYLTHVGFGLTDIAAVMPVDGEVCAVVPNPEEWTSTQPWCSDVRSNSNGFSAALIAKLEEVPLPNRRVGIVGMPRDGERSRGEASLALLTQLQNGLPDIDWVDSTDILSTSRITKSAEEVAFLERSMSIVDASFRATLEAARLDATDGNVWTVAFETVARLGSEPPVRVGWTRHDRSVLRQSALGRRAITLETPWIGEFEAAWGGYRARGAQTFILGNLEAPYPELVRLCSELWGALIELIHPGIEMRQLRERIYRAWRQLAPKTGTLAGATCEVRLVGAGLGWDKPRIGSRDMPSDDLARTVAPGWCFSLAARVALGAHQVVWGDTLAVGSRSARCLGKTPQGREDQ